MDGYGRCQNDYAPQSDATRGLEGASVSLLDKLRGGSS